MQESPISSYISRVLNYELIRYGIASLVALSVDLSFLYFLTSVFSMHYLISAAIGFSFGLITVYILSRNWVFSTRSIDNNHLEFAIFASIGIIGLAINEAGMFFFTEYVDIYYIFSKLLTTIIVFTWNYTARKYALFS